MGGFVGSMFGFLGAFAAFALMAAVVAYGFRTSEKAVNRDIAKRDRDNAARSSAGASHDPLR